jgi:site-specific DNA recombinase
MAKTSRKQSPSDRAEHRCGLYGRVSTDRQAAVCEGGLDTQFALMERYVLFENDRDDKAVWTVGERYREEGRSGKDLDRPELNRLRRDIVDGHIDTVVVHKIDRISRSIRDFFELWEFFDEHSVRFVSLNEKFDTTTPIGRAMLKLVLVFAELEREQTAERTSATMSHRADKGLWNGGRVMGYSLDPEKKGVLQVNPAEARIVRKHIFEAYLELRSTVKLARYLDEKGIRTPEFESRRGRKQGGKPFEKTRLVNMLSNPVFLGKINWNGEVHEGQHEGIIAPDLFNSVNRILDGNRRQGGRRADDAKHVFLLQGIIRCGRCGSPMTPKWSCGRSGRYFYYRCSKEVRAPASPCEDAKFLPAGAAEEYVLRELRKWSLSEDEITRVVREVNGDKEETLARIAQETAAARARLRKVERKIEPLVRAVEDGGDLRSVNERLLSLEQQRTGIDDELQTLEMEREAVEQDAVSTAAFVESYQGLPAMLDLLEQAGERRALKDLLARYVEVIEWHQARDNKGGTVKIMLFEQEQLGVPDLGETQTGAPSGERGAPPGSDWLPG